MAKSCQLTKREIFHLASLARLKLNNEEIKRYQKQLTETLEYVSNLDELETKGIMPTSQVSGLTNVYFLDGEKNQRGLTQEAVLKNARKKKDKYFVTEKII